MSERRDSLSDWTLPPPVARASGDDAPVRCFDSADAALAFLSLLPPPALASYARPRSATTATAWQPAGASSGPVTATADERAASTIPIPNCEQPPPPPIDDPPADALNATPGYSGLGLLAGVTSAPSYRQSRA